MWVHNMTAPNNDATNVLANITVGSEVYLQEQSDSTRSQLYKVTTAPVNRGTYTEIGISWIKEGGAAIGNNDSIYLGIVAVGQTGPAGPPGQGVPAGGTAGQILEKNSATDFDTLWASPPGGPPSGPAGGDLTGTYPAPTVRKSTGAFTVGGALSVYAPELGAQPPNAPPNILGTSSYVQVGVNTTNWGTLWQYQLAAWVAGRTYRIVSYGNSGRAGGTARWLFNIGSANAAQLFDATIVSGVWSLTVLLRVTSATAVQSYAHFMHIPGGAGGQINFIATDRNMLVASTANPAGSFVINLVASFDTANAGNSIDCWQSQLEAF